MSIDTFKILENASFSVVLKWTLVKIPVKILGNWKKTHP